MKTVVAILLLTLLTQAKTVLISDIDDTIKVSNVLDKSSALENSRRVDNVFYGMPQLYQSIQARTDLKFVYLSNAPKSLMTRYHREFLIKNQFPNGSLALRENLLDKNHKIKIIRSVIKTEKPTVLILIGDNGEHDPEVYAQTVKEYPHLEIYSYIRLAYSAYLGKDRGTELQPNQMGFVSPIEVALSLREKSILTLDQVNALEKYFAPFALTQSLDLMKGALAFPGWQDCRDFKIPDSLRRRQTDLGRQLLVHIIKRCSVPGIDTDDRR